MLDPGASEFTKFMMERKPDVSEPFEAFFDKVVLLFIY